MKFGIPFDVAFSLDRSDRIAYLVIMGEAEGGTFVWDSMRWKDHS